MAKIAIIGAGTWGMALANMLSNHGNSVSVWSAISDEIVNLSKLRKHPNLPGMIISDAITFTTDIDEICREKDIYVIAVPSIYVRSTITEMREHIPNGSVLVCVSKGIEADSLLTMSEIIREEINKDGLHGDINVVALSGPTHAEEVALGLPTTIVSACEEINVAKQVQEIFSNEAMRVYTNGDIRGVEICGALKNVIAVAAGISRGLGYGDNIIAAIVTRGMTEIARLGKKMGCLEQTFYGLAGIGDLIVTATSIHSRNNRFGCLLGQGYDAETAKKEVGMVVEGVNTLPASMQLMKRYEVDMPIVESVYNIVLNGQKTDEVVKYLMGRSMKDENGRGYSEMCYENAIINNRRGGGMKRVITYGTFDLLHYGHINLLKRAKALGDYLIVAISTDEFNWNEKQKKCYFSYEQRKALVEALRYVDLVIPEEKWEQKKNDVHEYHIDTFVIGDDWKGKFDFLKEEGCEVVYLPRTPEISTTQIKKDLNK